MAMNTQQVFEETATVKDSGAADVGRTRQKITAGAPHFTNPSQNAFGMQLGGEIVGTGVAVDTVINLASGLSGVMVENINSMIYTTAPADDTEALVYVAFNNSIFNDTSVAGLRHVIGPNKSKFIPFPDAPAPTQMTISVNAVEVTAAYTAAEG